MQSLIPQEQLQLQSWCAQELFSNYSYSRGRGTELFSNHSDSRGRGTELFSNHSKTVSNDNIR